MGQKIKKVEAKKLVKSNKSISRFFFDQIPFFAISKMAKNQFLYWKKFKTAKNAISRNIFIWFHKFYYVFSLPKMKILWSRSCCCWNNGKYMWIKAEHNFKKIDAMGEMWRLSPPDGDWCFLDRRSPGHKISAKNQYHLNRVSRLEAPTKESTGDRDLILSKYTYLYYIQQNILLRFNARALSERRIDAPETVGVECVTYESCGFKIWWRSQRERERCFSSYKAWLKY